MSAATKSPTAPAAPTPLSAALEAAAAAPERDDLWDALEELAGADQRPDEVAALHREVLGKTEDAALCSRLGERAVRFQEEWFGTQAEGIVAVLDRVLTVEPAAEWALRRATVLYTRTAKWDALLGLYDRVLAATTETPRRRELLAEAARVAKDFAGDPDRTIEYLQQLRLLSPADAHVSSQLERLLERQGRWADLVALLVARIEHLPPEGALALRQRVAVLRLERQGDAAAALADGERVLDESDDDEGACALLERIVRADGAAAPVRWRALERLRARYEASGREAKIVPLLLAAVAFAGPARAPDLHREAADRLAAAGDRAGAIAQLATLLALEPGSTETQTRLHQLAVREDKLGGFASALIQAAVGATPVRRGELLLEAAHTLERAVGDQAAALALYREIETEGGAAEPVRLEATRRLAGALGRRAEAVEAPTEGEERLGALERLAGRLPAADPERRTVLGEVARLATARGAVDRAVAAWQARLAVDPADREALSALVALLDRTERWAPLVEALRHRATLEETEPLQRRTDLERIARLQAGPLSTSDAAIATWIEIRKTFGDDAPSSDALADLLSKVERFSDLAALLDKTAQSDRVHLVEVLVRLGDACRGPLAAPERAAALYAEALAVDPRHAGALAGAKTLSDAEDEDARRAAVDALASAYARTGQVAAQLGLLPRREAIAADDVARVILLSEAARLAEVQAGDARAALDFCGRALALAPEDGRLETEVLRLGARANDWTSVLGALRAAIAACDDAARVAHLAVREAALLEGPLGDLPGALDAYRAAFDRAPNRSDARDGVVRCAARLGRWELAAQAAFASPVSRQALEKTLLPLLESVAAESRATAAATEALEGAISAAAIEARIEPTLARDLEAHVARSWMSGADESPDRAEAALLRAAGHARRARGVGAGAGAGGTDDVTLLRRLLELQRRKPDRALFDTLVALAGSDADDLDALVEAAEVAGGVLDGGASGEGAVETALLRVHDRAVALVRAGRSATGTKRPEEALLYALETLAARAVRSGDRKTTRAAVDRLLDATRLPLAKGTVRVLRQRASAISIDRVGDRRLGAQILQSMVDEDPGDLDAAERLARLYTEDARLPELYALRREELGRTGDLGRRLALRLELDRLAAAFEDRSGRIETLRANLEEQPGHLETIDTLAALLEQRLRHAELADVYGGEAQRLEQRGEGAAAARLLARLAVLAEDKLRDLPRAVAAWVRVAELDPRPEGYEALGRLYLEGGDALTAAGALEKWMAMAAPQDRPAAALRLAEAYKRADRKHRAQACLERALAERPAAGAVRAALTDMYRASEAWEPLVRTLAEGTEHLREPDAIVASAREAAALAGAHLPSMELAMPALERAVAIVPGDRELRLLLVDSLIAAGELAPAKQSLEGLLKEAGRRRSRERAVVHHLLAKIARAEKKPREALGHLEQASEMDLDDALVLLALAEVSEELAELDRAEQAYRALLLSLRRPGVTTQVSASEVLLRLRKIALDRGQTEKATDLLDSAVADAVQAPAEAERLQRALRARGETDILRALLGKRLQATAAPAEQAGLLLEQAALAEEQGRVAEALEAGLLALEKAPERPEVDEQARRLAKAAGQPEVYLRVVEGLVDSKRRFADATTVARLLLSAGEVAEQELAALPRASELYGRAAAFGVEAGEHAVRAAWALVRVAKARGQETERKQALKALQRMTGESAPLPVRIEALFLTAEMHLAAAETRDEGLAALAQALERSPDVERAFAIVRAAGVPDGALKMVLPLYERVARASGDEDLLLDFLERRAALPSATPEDVKEGVELARALGHAQRAEALLERAVALGRPNGLAGVDWALLDLARLRKDAGDVAGAVAWLEQALAVGEQSRVQPLLEDVARHALESDADPALAARVYERLWERAPTERRNFEPLMALFDRLGDRAGADRVARATVEKLLDPGERNALRLTWARTLLTRDATDAGAVEVLRDVLLDDPTSSDAIGLLADIYEKTGDEEGLEDLLARELEAARGRNDVPAIVALALRIGARQALTDPEEARALYRQTLTVATDDVGLMRALSELLSPEEDGAERADLLERLLRVEDGAPAAALALELADRFADAGDDAGERRILELGRARAPRDAGVYARLSEHLRGHDAWAPLAALLVEEAGLRSRTDEQVALLHEAAGIEHERLGRRARAADHLRKARALAPGDERLVRELCELLVSLDDVTGAIDEITRALGERGIDKAARLGFLGLRAGLRERRGEHEAAVADLEEVAAADPVAAAPGLLEALVRWRDHAAEVYDVEGERRAVMHLSRLHAQAGDNEEGRAVLSDWTWRHPEDREALALLLERDEASESWESFSETCVRLIEVETGDDQLALADRLVAACERLGTPAAAIPGLELVARSQPESTGLFDRLTALYEKAGERRKQAAFLSWAADRGGAASERFGHYKKAGDLFLAEGDIAAATESFGKALSLQPGDRDLALRVAETYIAHGRLVEAEEILHALMTKAGRDMTSAELSNLQHKMAQLAEARGDHDSRFEWLKKSFDTNRKNGDVAVEVADIAEGQQDWDLAVKALRAVTLLPNGTPDMSVGMAFYRQARIALATNDRPRALIFAKRALQEDPKLAEATELLRELGSSDRR